VAISYSELVATKSTLNSIKGWINWDLAPATDILSDSEAFIYSSLRIREMKRIATGSILAGSTFLAMPPDFIAPRSFKRIGDSAGKIDILDDKMFEDTLPLDQNGAYPKATPTKCTIYDDPPFAYFDAEADKDYPYRLVYWRRPEALAMTNETNFLCARYPMLLRSTCLGYANLYMKQPDVAEQWLTVAGGMITQANSDYDLGEQANRVENYWESN
jgi:hypothetical protein